VPQPGRGRKGKDKEFVGEMGSIGTSAEGKKNSEDSRPRREEDWSENGRLGSPKFVRMKRRARGVYSKYFRGLQEKKGGGWRRNSGGQPQETSKGAHRLGDNY